MSRTRDDISKITRDICSLKNCLQPVGTSANQLSMINRLDSILASSNSGNTTLSNIEQIQQNEYDVMNRKFWTSTPGHSSQITYYAASVPGNPTTSISNVEKIEYFDGATLVFTQTFTYNSNGDVISITTT